MPNCKLEIHFNREDKQYASGERVEGYISVEVDSPISCKGLNISYFWQTHGKGTTTSGIAVEQGLFEGEWQSGSYSYPFSFVIEEGPESFQGELFGLDWVLKVTADIPFAFDPKSSERFSINPVDARLSPTVLVQRWKKFLKEGKDAKGTQEIVSIVQICVIGLPVLGVVGKMAPFQPILALLILLICGALLCWWKKRTVSNFIVGQKLKKLRTETAPNVLQAGDQMQVRVQSEVAYKTQIDRVTLIFECREICSYASKRSQSSGLTSSGSKVHKKIAYSKPYLLQENLLLPAGDRLDLNMAITIPKDVVPSFNGIYCKNKWVLIVKIEMQGWPSWHSETEVAVCR